MRRPSFPGAIRGEAIKVTRQLSFWLMLAGALVLLAITVVGITTAGNIQDLAKVSPPDFTRQMLNLYGTVFQVGSGILILIVGSRLIAMEYSSGTIRIAYARGVGRLQLLLSKMTLLTLMAIALLAGYILIVSAIIDAIYATYAGSGLSFAKVSSDVWQDFGYWLLVQGISMGIAILLAAAAAGLGRSLAFAMAASLAFFPLDNFLVGIMALTARATKNQWPWTNITEYLLGPNLNVVLGLIEPDHRALSAFAPPLNTIDGRHALIVIGVWAVVFVVIAVGRAVRPDVLE